MTIDQFLDKLTEIKKDYKWYLDKEHSYIRCQNKEYCEMCPIAAFVLSTEGKTIENVEVIRKVCPACNIKFEDRMIIACAADNNFIYADNEMNEIRKKVRNKMLEILELKK